jgi:hypothetical protein
MNRRIATGKQVEAVKAAFEAETVTLDLLLDAQRQRAEAEVAYFRALTDYQRGIAQVHFRKGSILEFDGVYLAEGPWPAKAQFDAKRLARQRDAGHYLDYGFTRPGVISRGAYLQNAGDGPDGPTGDYRIQHQEGGMTVEPEIIPTPMKAGAKSTNGSGSVEASPQLLSGPTGKPAKAESFDWSGLNLPSSKSAATAAAKTGNQERATGASQQVASNKGAEATGSRPAVTRDSGVRQASFQDWKPSASYESGPGQPPRTSGWQGTLR